MLLTSAAATSSCRCAVFAVRKTVHGVEHCCRCVLCSCFSMQCNLRTRVGQAAVALSLYVCVPIKPVSNNRLSWLKFFVFPSQSLREYV